MIPGLTALTLLREPRSNQGRGRRRGEWSGRGGLLGPGGAGFEPGEGGVGLGCLEGAEGWEAGWGGLAGTFSAPVTLALIYPRMTRAGCLAGIIVGALFVFVWRSLISM